jgi:hypothetical protein
MADIKQITWRKLINTINQTLIDTKTKASNASVGEFEFGGLKEVSDVLCTINPKTAALLVLDNDAFPDGAITVKYNGKSGLNWLAFVAFIEALCLENGLLPDEVSICHLEIRDIQSVSELSIYVDKRFKSLCITDKEQRINGTNLNEILGV